MAWHGAGVRWAISPRPAVLAVEDPVGVQLAALIVTDGDGLTVQTGPAFRAPVRMADHLPRIAVAQARGTFGGGRKLGQVLQAKFKGKKAGIQRVGLRLGVDLVQRDTILGTERARPRSRAMLRT